MRKGRFARPAAEIAQRYSESVIRELQKFSPLFDVDLANVFDVRHSLKQRNAIGAPSPRNITAQIKRWRKQLGQ